MALSLGLLRISLSRTHYTEVLSNSMAISLGFLRISTKENPLCPHRCAVHCLPGLEFQELIYSVILASPLAAEQYYHHFSADDCPNL